MSAAKSKRGMAHSVTEEKLADFLNFETMNKLEKEEKEFMELMGGVLKGCLSAIAFCVVLIMLVLLMASCKTRTVVVETVRTDTTYITKHLRDSIWLHDSIYMHEYQKGDTVFMLRDRWHTQYVEKQVHDTTYVATHDTIPKPYPVEVKVPRELSRWQKLRMNIGSIALALLVLWLGWRAWKLWKFFHP